ncbi:DUF2147 domain-containing protein [Pseudohalioglobus sediminis]|nr:DUF2147 domain-containing protein [Pseudohalioglobus sediminis]
MLRVISLLAAVTLSASTMAASVEGVWKTETNDEGGYLEITVSPCSENASLTCGLITQAVRSDGPNPDYEHIGKLMIEDMQRDDERRFSGGTIWDPEADKVYKSKMQLDGNELEVEGCIAFFCDGQTWTRVE